MKDRKFLGTGLTALSLAFACSILLLLLIVATASTPDRFRQVDASVRYLQQSVAAVKRGIEVAESQQQLLEQDVVPLDESLDTGRNALGVAIAAVYDPVGSLDLIRVPLMQWTNAIDASAGGFTEPELVLEMTNDVSQRVDTMRIQISEFAEAQSELNEVQTSFDSAVNALIGNFREQGMASVADSFFVFAGQIRANVRNGKPADLDATLALADEMSRLEAEVALSDRPAVRGVVNMLYTMVSVRRNMAQAVVLMDAPSLETSLARFSNVTTRDQLYILQAVNDARVLLNVYTVLLLGVLGFFGIRLKASHTALNRSHDDLELRVAARTHDLEQANTDLKESQVQLVQAEKMSSLGQLVAGVMHEINTPLLYVLNNTTVTAEAVSDLANYMDATLPVMEAKDPESGRQAIKRMLSKRGEFDADELAESIEEIDSLAGDSVEGLNQISELVQSLKDFSRLDRVAEDSFDIREGIEKTLTITRNLLKHGVEVRKELQDVPEIFCSPSRINQVLINLVTNAVQAMQGEGTLTIKASAHKGAVQVIVEDTGCGIAPQDVDKVMDPFFTTKPVGEGTGLGLSIVHQIVEQHDGQIFIDSKVGVGTRVTLSLPVAGPSAGQESPERPAGKEAAA